MFHQNIELETFQHRFQHRFQLSLHYYEEFY
jgi:hypothetical protein